MEAYSFLLCPFPPYVLYTTSVSSDSRHCLTTAEAGSKVQLTFNSPSKLSPSGFPLRLSQPKFGQQNEDMAPACQKRRLTSGAREPGGGGQGGQLPPNFLSQWDGYACAPPKIWQSLGMSTLLPPPSKNRSCAPAWRHYDCRELFLVSPGVFRKARKHYKYDMGKVIPLKVTIGRNNVTALFADAAR